MIKPAAKPDWFVATQDVIRPIAAAPGIVYVPDVKIDGQAVFQIHRNLLPLIEGDEAARLREYFGSELATWAARDAATEPLGFKLRTTQHQAVDFIRARRGTLLGDEQRVGKTLAAAYSHEPELGKLVVITPLIAREVWRSWLARIWPDTPIGIMTGKTFDPDEASKPIVIGHYDIIQHWQSGEPIGTLILDEAHWLANHKTRRAKAAVLLQSRAVRVIAATGTPIWNMPTGLWSVLGIVAPGAWGGYHEFCRRYAAPVETAYGARYTGLSNGAELSARLSEVMIRRRWVDVQQDLPPITRNVAIVELSLADRRKLDVMAQSLRKSDKTHTAAQLALYRAALSKLKIPAAIAEARSAIDSGQPVVIWTWHRDTAEQIMERLNADGYDAFGVTGDTPQKRREPIFEHWRSLLAAALIVTMPVAQVGISLAHSRRAIFAEIEYIPAIISQAEMRTFDPTRAMNATYVVADHYVDRKIASALAAKLGAAEPVHLGTGEGAIGAIDRALRGPDLEPDMDRFLADILNS